MHVTTAALLRHGYTPSPNGLDKTPQLRALSSNVCPNADPRYLLMLLPACCPYGPTAWGYCGACWESGSVPPVWGARVQRSLDAVLP